MKIKYSCPKSCLGKAHRAITSDFDAFPPYWPLIGISLLVSYIPYRGDIEFGQVESEWPRVPHPYCMIQFEYEGSAPLCRFVLFCAGQ